MLIIDNLKCYFSWTNKMKDNMVQNELREFIDFLKEHRNFYLSAKSYVEYPESSFAPEDKSKFPIIKRIIINCNGLSLVEFEMKLKELSDYAIFYVQNIYANFEKTGNYFLDSQYDRLMELYADINRNKSEFKAKIIIDSNYEELTQDDFKEEHYDAVRQYLNVQKNYIELVMNEYIKVKAIVEDKPSQKIGYRFGANKTKF